MTLSTGERRYAMVVLTAVYMFNFIDRQILAILLPSIKAEFGTSDTWLGFLVGTAFALFYVVLGIPIARYADRANRRNLVALALAVWSGMTALSGFAGNIWHLTLARVGVGIGEAGCSPPVHSMIADYYPPEKRATAMGFYTLGISAGIMAALIGGGWIVQNIGWREAFFIVGLPGLILAFIVRFTLIEPERGASESRIDSGVQPTLKEVRDFLWSRPSFHHMGIAAGLTAFVGYAVVNWAPSFIARSYGMDLAQLGLWFGIIVGVAGGAGFFFGGYISDKLGQRSRRRPFNFLAISMLLAAACNFTVFMAPTAFWCLVMMVVPTIISNFYLAPVLAQAQSLVSLRMRAIASALVLLIINIIGLAMGPLLTGLLSDLLRPIFDHESMRYSLMIVSIVALPWAALHYYLAGRSIEADLVRAAEKD